MRVTKLILITLFLLSPVLAFANLERQIYLFSQQSDLFRRICFDADGQFKENAVIFDPTSSLRETAIDCDAQAIALNQQRLQIEQQIQAGGADCDVEIRDPALIDFMSGIESVAEEVQCPGNGGALQCVGDIACNLTSSMVPRFTRDVASLITGNRPRSCGADGGTNCIENLLAGAVFNLRDTGCGIASLFGYNCDQTGNSEAASADAAVIASFQNNEQVASFSEDPWNWMKQTASAIFTQIGESILERFGCAQWENPSRPFMSTCLRPMPWSCADCSAKTNMVCGVLGYIGGEIAVSFFTGAAVGIVARTAAKIGVEAAIHFPRATATAGRVAAFTSRWAARGGASVRNIWGAIARTPTAQAIGSVATGAIQRSGRVISATTRYVVSANEFARKRIFVFQGAQDAAVGLVRQYARLTEEAFSLGYRSTAVARSSTITNLEQKYVRLSDIRSGAYAPQGIRTPEDFFRYSTRTMSPADRSRVRLAVTSDGADSRVLIVGTEAQEAGRGAVYQLTDVSRAPASTSVALPPPPRRPEVIVRPPEAIVEADPITVTASRLPRREYPVIPASTRSQDDVLRSLGPDTPFNRELATVSRGEFGAPADFEAAAFDLHEAWKTANPQLRQSRPGLFVDYDDLPAAEKIRLADDLARGLRESNPNVLSSPQYADFRARLTGSTSDARTAGTITVPEPSPASLNQTASITVGGSTRITRPVQDVGMDIRADLGARTGGVRDPDNLTDITSGRSRSGGAGEDAIRRFGGENVSYQDREIIMDIILGGPRKNQYFGGRNPASDAFQRRYRELEPRIQADPNLSRYRADIEALAAERIATGNRLTDEELADISRSGIRTDGPPRQIPCSAFANVTPGAFPAEGNCRRVKFDQDVNGRYCSCGAMGKTSFTWLVRCPTSTSDFRSLSTYVDELALPHNSAPEMCTRVDIPRGKECYIGPTSATFAGFGGTTQILCEHRAPRTEAGLADVSSYGLDFGGAGSQAVRPVRWSPFSTFPEFQSIIDRASRSCAQVCDVNEYRAIQEEFARARSAIAARGTPADLARLRAEERSFELYLSELGSGRRAYPTFTDNATAGAFNDRQRVQVADILVGRVDGAENIRRRDALIRAHEVAPERGFGTYTQADLREKRTILMYGMGPEELAAYRRANGNRNPPEIFSGAEADTLMRNRIAGREAPLSPEDSFIAARSDAVRALDLRRAFARGSGTREDVLARFKSAAQGYEAEAVRQGSAQLIRGAWIQYARAGDREGTLRMIEAGATRYGMGKEAAINGLRQEVQRLDREIATNPDPLLILERDTLRAAAQEAERRFGLAAPAAPARPAVTVTPARPEPVRAPATPEPVRPAPEVAAPQPPDPTPARPQYRPVSEIEPRRAQDLANDYRLGRNGKTRDPGRAAELYYRAADDLIRRESQRTRAYANGETNFMGDRNFNEAFMQSLQGDGTLAIRMLEDIRRSGGETRQMTAVNAFLRENFERFNDNRLGTPVERENFRKFIQHVQENYGSSLYDPQRNYLRSWSTRQSD